jgi:hypothetical protein
MRYVTFILGISASLLMGCDQAPSTDTNRPIVWRAPPLHVQSAGVAALKARLDGAVFAEAPLYGQGSKQQQIQNSKGVFDQVTVSSVANMMLVEADVFALLARLGYSRRMVKEEAGLFVVDYVNSRDLTISAVFREDKGEAGVKSQVVFTWQGGAN